MGEAFDYVEYHVDQAARHLADARGKRVLVVGCNRGREVSLFLDAGAREVWGIDVMDEVGIEYPHEHARYLRMSAEAMDLDDSMFEIVFCLATMEHISRPEAAFPEIARVTAPGGFLYVLSAPLWHSRQGHHRSNIFDVDRYPWIHLRFDEEMLKRMCETRQIEYPGSVEDVLDEVGYMMSPAYFNKRPARDYVRICSELKAVVIERNDLDLEPESVLELLPDDDCAELIDQVGDAIELRALTHTLAAWKVRRPPGKHRAATSAWTLRARMRLRTRLRRLRARLQSLATSGRVHARQQSIAMRGTGTCVGVHTRVLRSSRFAVKDRQ
jgi:SAM-dependent methyltransferase